LKLILVCGIFAKGVPLDVPRFSLENMKYIEIAENMHKKQDLRLLVFRNPEIILRAPGFSAGNIHD